MKTILDFKTFILDNYQYLPPSSIFWDIELVDVKAKNELKLEAVGNDSFLFNCCSILKPISKIVDFSLLKKI
jgi:hypothetical protein